MKFKTMAVSLMLAASVLMAEAATNRCSVTLAWDASPSANVTGYNIYWGTASRTYSEMAGAGTNLTLAVTNLAPGTGYYFAATAYDGFGLESDYSEEAAYTTPAPPQPPSGMALVSVTVLSSENLAEWTVLTNLPAVLAGTTNGIRFYKAKMNITP